MNLRTIPRAAVGGYVKLLRLPIDTALALMGRNGATKVAVDRAEATARGVAGQALGDEELKAEAGRRSAAADERARANRLRAEAQSRQQEADAELEAEQRKAEERRRQAAKRAADRRKQAAKQRDARKQQATKSAGARKQANAKAAEAEQEAIEDRAERARLEQLDREAVAIAEREEALTAADEAQRLGDAAAANKAARKRS
jgi:hypothetical protein